VPRVLLEQGKKKKVQQERKFRQRDRGKKKQKKHYVTLLLSPAKTNILALLSFIFARTKDPDNS